MLAFLGLSPMEVLIVGVVAVLLFGGRLPMVARSAGKSLTEFRRGLQDLQDEFRDAMREAEAAATPPRTPLTAPRRSVAADTGIDNAGEGQGEENAAAPPTEGAEDAEAPFEEGYPEPVRPPFGG